MAFIPVANTFLIELQQSYLSQLIENTLYAEAQDPISPGDIPAIASALFTWWGASVAPLVGAALELRQINLTDLTSDISPSMTVVAPSVLVGTESGDAMPGSVALAVSFRTAGRGRSSRGRNFVAGLTTATVVGNLASATFVNGLRDAYDELIGIFNDIGYTWVVVSRFHNLAPRVAGVTTPITTVVVTDNRLDSMRPRLAGRGT
jgi:hypothetical protein